MLAAPLRNRRYRRQSAARPDGARAAPAAVQPVFLSHHAGLRLFCGETAVPARSAFRPRSDAATTITNDETIFPTGDKTLTMERSWKGC